MKRLLLPLLLLLVLFGCAPVAPELTATSRVAGTGKPIGQIIIAAAVCPDGAHVNEGSCNTGLTDGATIDAICPDGIGTNEGSCNPGVYSKVAAPNRPVSAFDLALQSDLIAAIIEARHTAGVIDPKDAMRIGRAMQRFVLGAGKPKDFLLVLFVDKVNARNAESQALMAALDDIASEVIPRDIKPVTKIKCRLATIDLKP